MLDDLRTLLAPKLLTARARARQKERGRGARTAILIGMTAGCLLAREPLPPPDPEASTAGGSHPDPLAPAQPR